MDTMKKTAAVLTAAALALSMAGCGGSAASGSSASASGSASASSSSAASSSSEAAFDYSSGIDDDGHWAGVRALDYVTLPADYAAVRVPAATADISDETVDEQVDTLRSNYGTSVEITDRTVADGDAVNLDYSGTVDGQTFDNCSTNGNGTKITLGGTTVLFGGNFDLNELIGRKPGETFEVRVTFPDDYDTEAVRGKTAVFQTTVNYIYGTVLPDLTDEWVKNTLSANYGWTTVAEMRESIRATKKQSAIEEYVADHVVEEAVVSDIPQSMIDYQFASALAYLRAMASSYGTSLETLLYLYYKVNSVSDYKTTYADDAKSQVKEYLIVQAVAEAQGFTVTDADVAAYFKEKVGVDDYSSYLSTYGANYIRMSVLNSKVTDFLYAGAVLE